MGMTAAARVRLTSGVGSPEDVVAVFATEGTENPVGEVAIVC